MKYTFIYLITFIIISCNNNAPATSEEITNIQSPAPDTIDSGKSRIAKVDVTKVIPGSEHIRKAYSYFVIKGADTSTFRCHFSEWKADSTLFFVAKFSKTMTYKQQRQELAMIIAEASHDFNLKMLNTIGIGRLITTGDLAAKVTSQFAAIGYKEELNAFLLHSALTDDVNTLLNPYGAKVKEVVTEKQEYMPRKELTKYSILETSIATIPAEIIDCVVYLKVVKI
jgi:hypothetical protein